jgi:hypothetical protein
MHTHLLLLECRDREISKSICNFLIVTVNGGFVLFPGRDGRDVHTRYRALIL